MEIYLGLLIVAAFYVTLMFLDILLKSCSHYGYIQFLNGTGLKIKLFQITWTTTAVNKTLYIWGNKYPRFFNCWFNIGLFTSLILLPVSIYLIFTSFVQHFRSPVVSDQVVELVIPGVNIPASEIGYYSITLLISSIVHELGHALAAVKEDINLINVGTNIIFLLPVSYVNINSDTLFSLNPWKRLKILCAGVWHNLLLAIVGYLIFYSLPAISSPFFKYGDGIVITEIYANSPLFGEKGFSKNDIISSVNNCNVIDEPSWYKCLDDLKFVKPAFCVEAGIVHNLDESVHVKYLGNGIVSCCHADNKGNLCFEYLDSGILELPPYVCLPGRKVVELTSESCSTGTHACPKDTFCLRPVLTNNSNLFKIKRKEKSDVIYVGPVSDFLRTLVISSYIPKYSILSSGIPDAITKFLSYIVMFSMGLAIINIVPCIYMDGQHISNTILYLLLSKHLRTTHIKAISGLIIAFFTLLLLIHFTFVIWNKVT